MLDILHAQFILQHATTELYFLESSSNWKCKDIYPKNNGDFFPFLQVWKFS